VALPDSPQQQLDWEARHRMRAALAAVIAALAIFGGQLIEQVAVADAPSLPLLEGLQKLAQPGTVLDQPAAQVRLAQFLDDHAVEVIGGRVVTAIGFFALAYALTFLAFAVRARRPQFGRWVLYLPVVGGVLFGVAWIAWGVGRVADARDLLDGPGTIAEVQDIGETGIARVSEVLLQPAALALAVGIVLVSLNAMRTGLLTRFMGALGIVVGVFQIIQVGASLPLVQTFWLAGLALLFAGRRPGGDPPAWRTGRAEPWPSAQQAAEARKAQQEQEQAAPPPEEPEPEPERVPAGEHPATSKRKRKRRS
jgi:hypothetical protein